MQIAHIKLAVFILFVTSGLILNLANMRARGSIEPTIWAAADRAERKRLQRWPGRKDVTESVRSFISLRNILLWIAISLFALYAFIPGRVG